MGSWYYFEFTVKWYPFIEASNAHFIRYFFSYSMIQSKIFQTFEEKVIWKDVTREDVDGKDSFFVRGQIFSYLGKKGVVVKLAPPQVTEALKIQGARRQPDDGDPHSREFVEIPVNGPREVERAMMWLRRACRLGRTAAGPV